PDVPAELDRLVLWLLAKNPADRPASAEDVAERLRAIASGGSASSMERAPSLPPFPSPSQAPAPVPPPANPSPAAPYPGAQQPGHPAPGVQTPPPWPAGGMPGPNVPPAAHAAPAPPAPPGPPVAGVGPMASPMAGTPRGGPAPSGNAG